MPVDVQLPQKVMSFSENVFVWEYLITLRHLPSPVAFNVLFICGLSSFFCPFVFRLLIFVIHGCNFLNKSQKPVI